MLILSKASSQSNAIILNDVASHGRRVSGSWVNGQLGKGEESVF